MGMILLYYIISQIAIELLKNLHLCVFIQCFGICDIVYSIIFHFVSTFYGNFFSNPLDYDKIVVYNNV